MKEMDIQSRTNVKTKKGILIKSSIDSKVPRTQNHVNFTFAVLNTLTKTICCRYHQG